MIARWGKLSTSNELEELQNRKTRLEEESRSLKDRQKSLEERTKVLEEKIAIGELENINKATQDSISQIESKIQGLEQRLKEVSQESYAEKPVQKEFIPAEPPQETPTTPETVETVMEDEEEETFTVAAPEEPVIEQPTQGEGKKSHEKRKRKFF